MKKTLLLLALVAGVANAASITYSEMSDSLRESLVASYTFTSQGTADYSAQNFGLKVWDGGAVDGGFTIEDGHAVLGTAYTNPYNLSFDSSAFTGKSFTISFDLLSLTANSWQSLLSIYSDNGTSEWDHAMSIRHNDNSGEMELSTLDGGSDYVTGFGGTHEEHKIGTGITGNSGTVGKTVTFVSDGENRTLTLYIDGVQQGEAVTGWDSGVPTGIQFGGTLGGGNGIGAAAIDNLNIWDRALTASEVTSLIPEPTTATLSLLALAGLVARRRRK